MAILKNIAQEQVLPLAQQVEAEAGQQIVDVADVRVHLIRRLGERVVHLDAGDFRPFAQVVLAHVRGFFCFFQVFHA